MMHCKRCNAELKPSARFCVKCGSPTAAPNAAQPAPGPKPPSAAARAIPSVAIEPPRIAEKWASAILGIFAILAVAINFVGGSAFRSPDNFRPNAKSEWFVEARDADRKAVYCRLNKSGIAIVATGKKARSGAEGEPSGVSYAWPEIKGISFYNGSVLRADRIAFEAKEKRVVLAFPDGGMAFYQKAAELARLARMPEREAKAEEAAQIKKDIGEALQAGRSGVPEAERPAQNAQAPPPSRDNPNRPFELFKADQMLRTGDYSKAQSKVNLILNTFPDWDNALLIKGEAETRLGNYREAKRALSKVAAIRPDLAEPEYWLGRMYEMQKEWEPAIQAYGRALHIDPLDWKSRIAAAWILSEELDLFEEASNYLKEIDPYCRPDCGNMWIDFYRQAFEARRAMEMKKDSREVFLAYKKAFELLGAAEANKNFLSNFGDNGDWRFRETYRRSLFRFAQVSYEAGEWDEAEKNCRIAVYLEINPNQARKNLAELLYRKGDYANAAETLMDLLAIDPLDEWPWSLLVKSLYKSGQKKEAEKWKEKGLTLHPNFEELRSLSE